MNGVLTYEAGKIPGVEVAFGNGKYIVPPLNIEGVEKHEADIERVQKGGEGLTDAKRFGLIGAITLTALQRNYPDLDSKFVKKWIDMHNAQKIFGAVMGISGYKEQDPGEAQAGASTGPSSTPAS